MKHLANVAVVCLLWSCSAPLFAEEAPPKTVALICNADLPVTALDKATVEKVFLGKSSKVGDGGKQKKVTLAIQKSGAVHDAFVKYFVNKTASQFETYWKKLVFSGKATMPKSFKTDKELVAFIAKTSGAIGYIHVDSSKNTEIMTDKVKLITVKQK